MIKNNILKKLLVACICVYLGLCTSSMLKMRTSLAYSAREWTYEDCKNVISFIDEHFDEFVSEYNATVDNSRNLFATSIEFSKIIYLIEDDNYGIYIDFNDNNGYLVATGNYNIYELEVKGDNGEFRNIENLMYSYLDRFLYADDTGLHKIEVTKQSFLGDTVYPGQNKIGDGEIDSDKIEDYVSARYPDYTLEYRLPTIYNKTYFKEQLQLSYYIMRETNEEGSYNGQRASEGNCVLAATYNLINSWQDNGYVKNIPEGTIDLTECINNDIFYEEYGTGKVYYSGNRNITRSNGGMQGYYKWTTNSVTELYIMPELYSVIRDYAVSRYNYTPISNFNEENISDLIQHTANLYNNNVVIKSTNTITEALTLLEKNQASMLTTVGSYSYGDHATVLVGYSKYKYKSGWWIFSTTKYAYFYEIIDGHNAKYAKYFDPNTSAKPKLKAFYAEKY